MKRIFWAVQTAVFYLFSLLFSFVPEALVRATGRLVGGIMYRLLPVRREVAIDNIRQVLPYMRSQPEWNCPLETPEEIALETFKNLGTSLVETCLLYHGKGAALIDGFEVRGMDNFDAAREKGKGIVFLTGHCGNWELVALAYSRIFKDSMSVVARRQNNPYLNTMVEKMRMHYDNRVIYKDQAMRSMISVIRKNGTIGLLVDQSVSPEEGVMIPFLGRTAWASRAPGLLARKTGVIILPSFVHRENGHHVLTFNPPCIFEESNAHGFEAEDAKKYSGYIERNIIAHPTDWYWVHRRWKRAGEHVS